MNTPDRRAPAATHSGLPTQRAAVGVVPAPLHHAALPGGPFLLGADLRVVGAADDGGVHVAERLAQLLARPVPVVDHDDGTPGAVVVQTGAPWRAEDSRGASPSGAYRLTVGEDRVTLRAADPTGLAHAVTTLALLAEDGAVRPALVVDSPRFAWRGFRLDVARHFHDVAALVQVLDAMAELKLNVLHLHLADDVRWRLEVPSRPRLTEAPGQATVGGDHEGRYTAEDYATVQAHAAARGITVVPEIDVPGHLDAALHAQGQPTEDFLREVLGDVAAMTTGPYLQVAGDEPPSMDPQEYRRLVDLAAAIVAETGKKPVSWRAVSRGGARTASPATRAYLEISDDAETPRGIGIEWAGNTELRDAYEWDPTEVLPAVPVSVVVGLEAAFWTETGRTADDLFALLLPRLAAFAEIAWSAPNRREWSSFATRVRRLVPRWAAQHRVG